MSLSDRLFSLRSPTAEDIYPDPEDEAAEAIAYQVAHHCRRLRALEGNMETWREVMASFEEISNSLPSQAAGQFEAALQMLTQLHYDELYALYRAGIEQKLEQPLH